jgi:hypothetical protein
MSNTNKQLLPLPVRRIFQRLGKKVTCKKFLLKESSACVAWLVYSGKMDKVELRREAILYAPIIREENQRRRWVQHSMGLSHCQGHCQINERAYAAAARCGILLV